MAMADRRPPITPGERAPDFVLSRVNQEGTVSLADYRGKTPVLLAMMRGLYCAFCRRHVAQLATTRQKLAPLGVEVLAIVAMPAERLRLYYQYRPVSIPVAADPELVTHRSYGVPQPPITPEIVQEVSSKYLGLARNLQIPTTDMAEIRKALCERDGFVPVEAEMKERRDWSDSHGGQLVGQFLIDRDGIVRWVNIEGAKEGLPGLEKFPTDDEFVAAARQIVN